MFRQHHQPNGHESEPTPRGNGEQRSLACCSPPGHKELNTTQRLKNNTSNDGCRSKRRARDSRFGHQEEGHVQTEEEFRVL